MDKKTCNTYHITTNFMRIEAYSKSNILGYNTAKPTIATKLIIINFFSQIYKH